MALVLDATVGGATANSYLTSATANAYFESRPEAATTWASATTATKDFYLVAATERLEQESYFGTKASLTQRLLFPRSGVYDSDGQLLSELTMPRQLLNATCEVAWWLYSQAGTDLFKESGLEAFTDLRVGPLALGLRTSGAPIAGTLPAAALRWLRSLRRSPGAGIPMLRSG